MIWIPDPFDPAVKALCFEDGNVNVKVEVDGKHLLLTFKPRDRQSVVYRIHRNDASRLWRRIVAACFESEIMDS